MAKLPTFLHLISTLMTSTISGMYRLKLQTYKDNVFMLAAHQRKKVAYKTVVVITIIN